jgi:hypothetical protein
MLFSIVLLKFLLWPLWANVTANRIAQDGLSCSSLSIPLDSNIFRSAVAKRLSDGSHLGDLYVISIEGPSWSAHTPPLLASV